MKNILVFWMGIIFLVGSSTVSFSKEKEGLTPLGAEMGENQDGSIPAWTGGIVTVPKGYHKGGFHPDPFIEDKVLLTVTADNFVNYKDKLSLGQQEMFKKHPDYTMPIYPTRRSASYPQEVYKAIKKNNSVSKLAHHGDAVNGGGIAVPFPTPKNGVEAIWNHLLRYRTDSVDRLVLQVAVLSATESVATVEHEKLFFPFSLASASFDSPENILVYFKQEIFSPSRNAGTLILVHDPLDKIKERRRSWIYMPNQRKVNRAPFINYDSTPPTAWGLRTFDQYELFNGALDRYEWTLEGKQEMYVPYNVYRLAGEKIDELKVLGKNFIRPEFTRYELHRVWKVNAVLKAGKTHLYQRRIFYLDEDSWQILVSDIYNNDGEIWRMTEAHVVNFYEVPLILPVAETYYDLKSGQYLVAELQITPPRFLAALHREDFMPDTLRRQGTR